METIGDWKIYSAGELDQLPDETAEEAYRRGYCDGFVQAFNAMDDLPVGVSFHQMLHYMWEHWQQDLLDWRGGPCDTEVWPPQVRIPANAIRRLFTPAERAEIGQRCEYRCTYCHRAGRVDGKDPDGRTWHIDHIRPLARGGTNDPENLTLACKRCNSRKGMR